MAAIIEWLWHDVKLNCNQIVGMLFLITCAVCVALSQVVDEAIAKRHADFIYFPGSGQYLTPE